jgi:hypothetical protein
LGLVTIFYCLRFETSLLVESYDSHGHGGGIRTRLQTSVNCFYQSRSHIATDSQSVSLGVEPQNIYCSLTVTVLFLWGALSDERAFAIVTQTTMHTPLLS